MSLIKQPEIIARQVSYPVLVGFLGNAPIYQYRDVGYNLAPLENTWYEEEVDTPTTRTIRLAKRSDHTGLLVQIDKSGFYSGFIDIPEGP